MQQRDTLTPLDARNSLLIDRSKTASSDFSVSKTPDFTVAAVAVDAKETATASPGGYTTSNTDRLSNSNANPMFASRTPSGGSFGPPVSPLSVPGSGVDTVNPSRENLVMGAAPLGGGGNVMRQPTLPNFDLERGGFNAPAPGPRGYGGSGGQERGGYGQQQQTGGYGQQAGGYGGYNDYRGPYARY